jgi:hypothetical protein
MGAPQVWFTSTEFVIERGEDDETNPGIYGRALATWLAAQLTARGLEASHPLAEDWGWLVDVRLGGARLGVACANEYGSTTRWSFVLVTRELPFVALLRRHRTRLALVALRSAVDAVLAAARVSDIEWEPD